MTLILSPKQFTDVVKNVEADRTVKCRTCGLDLLPCELEDGEPLCNLCLVEEVMKEQKG